MAYDESIQAKSRADAQLREVRGIANGRPTERQRGVVDLNLHELPKFLQLKPPNPLTQPLPQKLKIGPQNPLVKKAFDWILSHPKDPSKNQIILDTLKSLDHPKGTKDPTVVPGEQIKGVKVFDF